MIESDTRPRAARAIAKTETQAAIETFTQLKNRRGHEHPPPPLISDGWGGYADAMVEVWGKVPEYKGSGRPPTKKLPQAGWKYPQMVNQRENGRVVGVNPKTIYGDDAQVRHLLGESTSYVERTNLTSRLMNGRLVRKTLGYSKELKMLRASSIFRGCGLQPWPGAKDAWDLEPSRSRRRWTLDKAISGDGGGIDGSHLGDRGVAHGVATSIHQHLIGRLPEKERRIDG